MAKPIKTDIYIKHYDNWAGYLYYFSVCAAASTGLGLFYDETMIGWFILSLLSTASFWAISREIAVGREFDQKPEVLNVVHSEKRYEITMSQGPVKAKVESVAPAWRPMSEEEKDALVRENKRKGIIHL